MLLQEAQHHVLGMLLQDFLLRAHTIIQDHQLSGRDWIKALRMLKARAVVAKSHAPDTCVQL